MKSVKSNILYNIIYQILILIIPLITAPYLSRVVGADGVGIYSYTYSIVYYFMLVVLLGVNNYGNRTIAKSRNSVEELSKKFWEIYLLQLSIGIIMLCIYCIYVFIFNIKFRLIAMIEVLFILSAIFDINWFFFGVEEFKKTVIRNSIIKIGTLLLIFCFVKSKDDLWKYTLIMSGMTFFGQLLLWGYLRKIIKFVKVDYKNIIKHLKPNLLLFIPVIAVSIYKIMDKIMLGSICNVNEVGFYENAEKIVNVPITLITALGTVMLPRITNMLSHGEDNKAKEYLEKSLDFIMFISFAMFFGLLCVGKNFAPLYFGKEFVKTGYLIVLLSSTLPFISFANVLRTQYLIPKEKDKIYIFSVILGAVINTIMNFIFIPFFGSIGACFGTIAAEFVVMFVQAYMLRKEINMKKQVINIIPFFIKALVMFVIISIFNYLNLNNVIRLVIQIAIGGAVYFILNFKYICSIIDLKKVKTLFLKKQKIKI